MPVDKRGYAGYQTLEAPPTAASSGSSAIRRFRRSVTGPSGWGTDGTASLGMNYTQIQEV